MTLTWLAYHPATHYHTHSLAHIANIQCVPAGETLPLTTALVFLRKVHFFANRGD